MKKITAIVRRDMPEQAENRLKSLGVPGITVTAVKGYGEYAKLFLPRPAGTPREDRNLCR